MNSIKFLLPLFIMGIFIINACSDTATASKNDTINNVPESVSMLSSLNVASMLKKADFEGMKKMDFYQDLISKLSKESAIGAKILEDPATSGIDLDKNIYIANDIDAKKINESYTYITFSLSDAAAFQALLEAAGIQDFANVSNYQYAQIDSKQMIAWSDNMGVYTAKSSIVGNLKTAVDKIFTTTKEASAAQNKDIAKALKGNHDMQSWMGSNALAQNPDVKMALGLANISPEALKDNFVHSYVDFDDGEVVGKATYFLQKGLTQDFGLLVKDKVTTDFSTYIPAQNLSFASTMALDFKGLNQLLAERPQAKSFINFSLREYGLSVDDIVNALAGDVMLAAYNNEDGVVAGHGILGLAYADKAALNKLLDTAVAFDILSKVSDEEYQASTMLARMNTNMKDARLLIKKDVVLISTNANSHAALATNNTNPTKVGKKIKQLSKANIFALLFDMERFKSGVKDLEGMSLSDLEVTTNNKAGNFSLKFDNKKENSLQQLVKMANHFYKMN